LLDDIGWAVKPTPEETYGLIKESDLFNLMGLICFKSDNIAKSTCEWFINTLKKPPINFTKTLEGGHLRPLGIPLGNHVLNLFHKLVIESVEKRNIKFEFYVIQLLKELEKNQQEKERAKFAVKAVQYS